MSPHTQPRKLCQEPEAVTWAREKAGLTKRALAARVGISEQLMSEIESGRRNATPANLIRIARPSTARWSSWNANTRPAQPRPVHHFRSDAPRQERWASPLRTAEGMAERFRPPGPRAPSLGDQPVRTTGRWTAVRDNLLCRGVRSAYSTTCCAGA